MANIYEQGMPDIWNDLDIAAFRESQRQRALMEADELVVPDVIPEDLDEL